MELKNSSKNDISPFYRIKCLFVGLQNVGKSSLINLMEKGSHDPDIPVTIGIEFISLLMELEEYPLDDRLPHFYNEVKKEAKLKENNQLVKAHIWDCSGSSKYFSIVKSYLRDVDIGFLVFDMTNRDSWNELEKWKQEIEKNAKFDYLPMLVLVGTKCDLSPHAISRDEINERAEKWNAKSYIVSCVYSSGACSIKRMMYKSLSSFHEKIITLLYAGKELPPHVHSHFYSTISHPYVDLDYDSKSKFCCYQ
jgi:small GTP-binding protein